jgi:hypothetical protein
MVAAEKTGRYQGPGHHFGVTPFALRIFPVIERLKQIVT